jgi:phosphomannomutase
MWWNKRTDLSFAGNFSERFFVVLGMEQEDGFTMDDLAIPTNSLPPTDGIRFTLEQNIRIIIRPSGTEPKIKCYIEVVNAEKSVALSLLEQLRPSLRELLS